MTEQEMRELAGQLQSLEQRLTAQHESLSSQIAGVRTHVRSIEQQLTGRGDDKPGIVSRLFLLEQRSALVYWLLGGIGTLALAALAKVIRAV